MGRKATVVPKNFEDDYDWPWKLSIELTPEEKPKVCFLSGKDREYFPEDPGHSRHGVEYSMNCHPGDTPNPNYFPSENRLQKPVSSKGYGMGGLSAPRFRPEHRAVTPGPGAYQAEISKVIQKPEKRKTKLMDDNGNEIRPYVPPPPHVFGSSMTVNRFGREPKWHNVGVGHYDMKAIKPCRRLTIDTGFGGGNVRMIPPTVTHCQFEGFDHCAECNKVLMSRDYFKSRHPIQMPQLKRSSVDEALEKIPLRLVSMCRECFCNLMTKGHSFWTKRSLLMDFTKTRHCINIHEHHKLPVFVHKAPCSLIRQLTRKEAMMAKYFTDGCERRIRERI